MLTILGFVPARRPGHHDVRGVGKTGLGLGNEEIEDNVRCARRADHGQLRPDLPVLAILASAVASLQTTFLPVARTMLSMGSYKAFPGEVRRDQPPLPVADLRCARRGHCDGRVLPRV